MRRARGLHFYTPASTANPTGWRSWNSRLSFYSPASYALPTTGTAMPAQRFANSGLGSVQFPNYAGLNRARTWRTRDNASSPTPWIYATERHGMSGLGVALPTGSYNPIPSGLTPIVSTQPQTGTNAPSGPRICPAWGCEGPPPMPRWFMSNPGANQQAQGSFVTSSPQTGSIVSYQPNPGTPIYPAGQQPASSSAAAAAAPVVTTTAPDPTATAAAPSWFSQDSLGLGLSNGVYAAIGLGLVLIFKKK